ncbi:2-dehydropantoate 2-reductase like [Lecanosticta acicola]|uniref:2-dehydropantoate 2-reductase n=1 Tax=Lecanosticta acicola TaxID=111012 RepID=A0AAI8Z210_9PEZI|nr:2-dehydropantoate 2-reductase like [Lecanosticta acicola]
MSTKVLVFGAGGVGCIYAAILERGGATVTCVCRTNYEAVKANGILIRSAKWGHMRARPNTVKTTQEATAYGPYDYVLVSSKAFPGTAGLIQDAVTPGMTAIVLAQNGIAIEEDYAALYPDNTITSGVVYLPTTQVQPGIVEHGTPLQRFEIGTFPTKASAEAKTQTQRLSELFTAGGADAPIYEDIQLRRWNKLSVNACMNPIAALTLCDDANYLRSSKYALDMAKDVMREIGVLATAVGYPDAVTEAEIEHHMERFIERLTSGGKEMSMLVDIRNDRPIEVEAILGNAIRKAEELQVLVPYLKMLYVLAKARDFATLKNDGWKPIRTID